MNHLRNLSVVLSCTLLAALSVGCDGGADEVTTSTHALHAQLDASSPAMSYDLQVRVFAPEANAIERFKRAQVAHLPAASIEAGFDISTRAQSPVDTQRLRQTFAATVEALAKSEVIGEREVRDAVNEPFFTSFPISACGGNFPCDLVIRIDLEGFELDASGALEVSGEAWVASEYYEVEIVNVDSFPTY